MEQKFVEQGITFLESLTKTRLINFYKKANKDYYNKSKPILTDSQYDILKEFIEKQYPTEIEIGTKVTGKNKVTLPFFMASMNKIKADEKVLNNWKKKFTGPYVLSAKLDGISALFDCREGNLNLYTRGDGKVGQNISKFIPYLQLSNLRNMVVRGELIIRKQYNIENKRNVVSGIINSKNVDKEKIRLVDFVPYEVIYPELKPQEQMQFLGKHFPIVVENQFVNTVSTISLSDCLIQWRNENSYEIDGVICTNNLLYPRLEENPKQSFAFKMVLTEQMTEATVIDVLWNVSKDGYLKPKVRFEPVFINGVKIEYATAFNASFIEENNIGVGAVVQLIRSGDVIPYIVKVLTPSTVPKFPSFPFVWNESHVDILVPNIKGNKQVEKQKIVHFFQGLKVDGFGKGTVEKVFDGGNQTIPVIMNMTVQDFTKLDGIKEKTATKIFKSMQEKISKTSLAKIMALSTIFERGFGEKKIELIVRNCPFWASKSQEEQVKSCIMNCKGMTAKSANQFVKSIPECLEFLKELKVEYKLKMEPPKVSVDSKWNGKNIVFSGFRDEKLEKEIKENGGNVSGSVTKKTSLVLVRDFEKETTKTKKAKELGILIEKI